MSITPKSKDIKLEPVDQLVCMYKGTMIDVDVLECDYKWNGEFYPTLTHISRKATGYKIEATTSSDFLSNVGVNKISPFSLFSTPFFRF